MEKQFDKELLTIIQHYKVKIINFNNTNFTSEINKRVNQIYVINLLEDVIKRNYIILLMKKYNINFTLIVVNKISNELYDKLKQKNKLISIAEMGCCLSHLYCLYQIILNNNNNCIIFEDDIILHKDFLKKFINIYDTNTNIDFLLLGAHDYNFSNYNYKNIIKDKKIYIPNKNSLELYGAHANYYSLNGAKKMFLIRMTNFSFFDKEYMLMFNHFKNSSYICYPNLALTNISQSHINHTKEFFSDDEKKYYKSCFKNFNFKNYNFIYINLLNESININSEITFNDYTDLYLYEYLLNFNQVSLIKNRLSMNFFTIKDIKEILNV